MKVAMLKYALGHWRLLFHMAFKTRHFGVNNEWWARFPSPIAWGCRQRIWGILTVMPIVRNIQSMQVRARIGWIPKKMADEMGLND